MAGSDVLIQCNSRTAYGWPYCLVSSEEYRQSVFSRADELELGNLPVHTHGCVVDVVNAEQFETRAPLLYRKFQKPKFPMEPQYSWNFEPILQYICGYLAILFTAMLLIEWRIRRASNPEQDPELLPEV